MNKVRFTFTVFFLLIAGNLLLAQGSWTLQTNPMGFEDSTEIGKVQFFNSNEGWISGGKGSHLHTNDAGANWVEVTPFPSDSVWNSSDPAVSMSWVNQTHGWIINSTGPKYGNSYGVVIHQTSDGGINWQKKVLSTEQGEFGFQIQFVDINNGWLIMFNFSSQNATFLKTTDGGNNWVPFNGAGIFYFADADNGWSYYGSGLNGAEPPFKILRTTNGGTDWTEQFSDDEIGRYNAIYFSDLNNGWIVGDAGKVLKTTNGGTNWEYVTNSGVNPNERSKTVFFLDANVGWISTKNEQGHGIIQHTTDGGTNWATQPTPLQDPQGGNGIFSIYFVDAQNGWLTASNGKICHYTGTTGIEKSNNTPNEFFLSQNYPNPFNPYTTIGFGIFKPSFVTLEVYNSLGQKIATLLNKNMDAGEYSVKFNASSLSSGTYFYKIQAGEFQAIRKMLLLE